MFYPSYKRVRRTEKLCLAGFVLNFNYSELIKLKCKKIIYIVITRSVDIDT